MYKTEAFEAEDLLVKNRGITRYFKTNRVPVRLWIGIMIFLTTYVNYTLRVNMSIGIVSMTTGKNRKSPECKRDSISEVTNSTAQLPDYGPRYEWDQHLQGLILGSYFWGYIITSLPGGFIAEWIGPFYTIFWSHIIAVVLNLLSVYGTWYHYSLLIVTRFIIGLCAGLAYPALQCMIARWAPPAEKGKFVAALMGNTLGTCLTWPLVGMITQIFGWDWGFYFISIQMGVFCLVFWFVASDGPDNHRFITEEEKKFILESQGGSVTKKKAIPPYKSLFLSLPFWSLTVLHFGNLWGLYLQLTGVPKFMVEVVGFNLRDSGGLAALPHLLRLFCGMAFGATGDYLKKKEVSPKFIRKFFVLFSHIIPGCFLIGLGFIGCNWIAIVGCLVVSMSINGAAVITNLQNPQDLAPNFAGTIFGIISFIGGVTGFIVPAITGVLTESNNGIKEWSWNFVIGGCVYIGCGLFFILFGSTERQPWNEKKDDPK